MVDLTILCNIGPRAPWHKLPACVPRRHRQDARAANSHNQHTIPVAVEPVALRNGFRVGPAYEIDAGTLLPLENGKPLKLDGHVKAPSPWLGRTNICVVDLDGDNNLDIVIGWASGYQEPKTSEEAHGYYRFATVKWFRNVGTNKTPKFRKGGYLKEDGWPLHAGGHNCGVHVADWDKDGKFELIIGTDYGQLFTLDHNEFSFDLP